LTSEKQVLPESPPAKKKGRRNRSLQTKVESGIKTSREGVVAGWGRRIDRSGTRTTRDGS